DSDYPRRAILDSAEGTVAFRLVIGTNGQVSSCELTRPSGHRALDDATCRLISRRARFDPATDETGSKVLGTYTGSVKWELPDWLPDTSARSIGAVPVESGTVQISRLRTSTTARISINADCCRRPRRQK